MTKQIAAILSLFIMVSQIISCGNSAVPIKTAPPASPTISPSSQPTDWPSVEPTETTDPIKEQISAMTLDDKIGQMVLMGLDGTTMGAKTKEMIATYHVGGFILYKDNITGASQAVKLLNQLKAANHAKAAPLWLSIDQEGGKVSRMPAEFIQLPPAADVGRANDLDYTYQIGQTLGMEVRSLGFNMDFAPVLDINSNPNNPVIGNRSFGSNPEIVITHGMETMKAIQSTQVAAVVKHFPGHGDTKVDSHLDLPVVNKNIKELEAFELLPFVEAIRQDADAIMIAHLLIPQVDDKYPASLSKKLITILLRGKLGFDGVIITDDMTMGGITKHYNIGEAAVKSIQAGSDIILVGHEYDKQLAVLKALKKSAQAGAITKDMLDQRVYRILSLKKKYQLKDSAIKTVDVKAVNRQIRAALNAKNKMNE